MKKLLFILSLAVSTGLALLLPLACFAFYDSRQLETQRTVQLESTDYSHLLVSDAPLDMIMEMERTGELMFAVESDAAHALVEWNEWKAARLQREPAERSFLSQCLVDSETWLSQSGYPLENALTWATASGIRLKNGTIYKADLIGLELDGDFFQLQLIASEDADLIVFFNLVIDQEMLGKLTGFGGLSWWELAERGYEEFANKPIATESEAEVEGFDSLYDMLLQYGYAEVWLPNNSRLELFFDGPRFEMSWNYL